MNPGLAVKLRPTGPWRMGPDSGARNQVDFIYHSDSLYSAITAAMARLGSLEDWLEATARNGAPAVCFSSCFPFLDEIRFVVPPRTLWPPAAPALLAARVRWRARGLCRSDRSRSTFRAAPRRESVEHRRTQRVPGAGQPAPARFGRQFAGMRRSTGWRDRRNGIDRLSGIPPRRRRLDGGVVRG